MNGHKRDYVDFVTMYASLSRENQARINLLFLRAALRDVIKKPGPDSVRLLWNTIRMTTIPDMVYFAGVPALVVSAVIAWAWAVSSTNPFLWLSFACLAAAVLMHLPKPKGRTDANGGGGLSF